MTVLTLARDLRERSLRIPEWGKLGFLVASFLAFYLIPLDDHVTGTLQPAFALLHEYARAHVLTCLVPAFFIAGAIAVYLNKDVVLRYLGPGASRWISYPLASLSGGVLAVCSCTVLPLFAGIYKRGAGLGPAIAFVFTGPAINVTAIFLTWSVLGLPFAAYRLGAAMLIAMVAGLVLVALFERDRKVSGADSWVQDGDDPGYSGRSVVTFIGVQVLVLVILGIGAVPWAVRIGVALVGIGIVLLIAFRVYTPEDRRAWIDETWVFTKQIMPLLFVGVFLAGLISAFLPAELVAQTVGGNGVVANAVASVSGAFMYFATLTEIPILQSLMGLGMGDGPVMAMLLTGNALSLPNLIVLRKILGIKRTVTYLAITVSLSVVAGVVFGAWIA